MQKVISCTTWKPFLDSTIFPGNEGVSLGSSIDNLLKTGWKLLGPPICYTPINEWGNKETPTFVWYLTKED